MNYQLMKLSFISLFGKQKISILIFFLLSFFFYSCKSKQGLTPEKIKTKEIQKNEFSIIDSIQKKQTLPDFQQIKIQGNVTVSTHTEVPELSMLMYIEKDKKIWTNVSFLIFSARALLTPEKFQAYEKIKKTYVDSDYVYVNELLGMDFVDFQAAEKLLIGKLCFPISAEEFFITPQGTHYELISKKNLSVGKGEDKKDYSRTLLFNSDFSLKSVLFKDVIKNESLLIEYENVIKNASVSLPNRTKITVQGSKPKEIILTYTSFDFETMETPFKIPSNYTERKIR